MATLSLPEEGRRFPNTWPPKAEPLVSQAPQKALWNPGPLRVLLPKADREEAPELTYANQLLVPKIPTSSPWASTLSSVKWGTERNSQLYLPSLFLKRLQYLTYIQKVTFFPFCLVLHLHVSLFWSIPEAYKQLECRGFALVCKALKYF